MNKLSPFKRIAYSAVLVALGVGLGYAFAWLPNIELVSLTAALAGFIMGIGAGAFVGALTFMLYSFISPFGMAPPPLWIAQGIGGALFGMFGGLFAAPMRKPLYAAAIGIAFTLFYDIITNAAGYFAYPTKETFVVYMASGIAFGAVHIASNAVLFAILFPLLARKVQHFRGNGIK